MTTVTERGTFTPKHPAKYSPDVISWFNSWFPHDSPILDPFGGVGTWTRPGLVLSELEYEWVSQSLNVNVVADSVHLPFRDCAFAGAVTSPTFGNRMADHHVARDDSIRNTYTHKLGRQLHSSNSGAMHWGEKYWRLHEAVYREVYRVLCPGARFGVHVSDFIASGFRVPVVKWHISALKGAGFAWEYGVRIPKRGNRMGANGNLRVEYEVCMLFRKD